MSGASDFDKDEALERMREEYEQETGEELPDHVIENYDTFFGLGPTVTDIEQAVESTARDVRAHSPEEYTTREAAGLVAAAAVLSGVVAFGAGFAIASSFGMAVAALVAAGVGFIIGGVVT